jgi:S1-C subfamily serine protease
MKRFLKLSSLVVVLGYALCCAAWGQTESLPFQTQDFMLHSSPGYLGVDLRDIGADRVSVLKLKDTHGAEVLAVDHDAPAAKAGLKAHDVLLEMNGQRVEDANQLRRMLHDMPPGHTVAFLVSRDGASLNVTTQLADRAVLQQQAWSQHFSVPEPSEPAPAARESFLGPRPAGGSRFLGTLIPNSLYVGADVNPVRAQLADYFGVSSGTGLLVENVDDQSPASRAGLKAGDVILKVNASPMISRNDWLKAIHAYRGQVVQVTIVRNKEEQTVPMSAGAPKKGR